MRQIDKKYMTSGDITKLDGTPIPLDEPLILFRGRDRVLVQLLEYYAQLCEQAGSPERQLKLIDEKIGEIKAWQEDNQARLKVPD